ncbi:MAG: hypothetical protein WC549_00250 [Actinomycetota bacterium]
MAGTIKNFVILCKECEKAGKPSNTHLHIDWNKKRYIFTCLNSECQAYEVYDENGDIIVVPKNEKVTEEKENWKN